MTKAVCRGVVHGNTVALSEENNWTEGTEVLVTPVIETPGSPAAVLAAMANAPKVPSEWVDELEQCIADGKRPPSRPVVFSEESLEQE